MGHIASTATLPSQGLVNFPSEPNLLGPRVAEKNGGLILLLSLFSSEGKQTVLLISIQNGYILSPDAKVQY